MIGLCKALLFCHLQAPNQIYNMELFIPDIFYHIAEFFDTADWKAFRLTCRGAESLFRTFCSSLEMMFRVGDSLCFGDKIPVLDQIPYPCSPFNKQFYVKVMQASMEHFTMLEKLEFFARAPGAHMLNLAELAIVFGGIEDMAREFERIRESPNADIVTGIYLNAGYELLTYLAGETVKRLKQKRYTVFHRHSRRRHW